MFDEEIKILRFMQGYGDSLLADIEPEDMCRQPVAGINHPAWIIGHLAIAADGHSKYAGGEPRLEAWHDRFNFGTKMTENLSDYPAKDELMREWHEANARLITAVSSANAAMLDAPTQGPLGQSLPTVGDFLAFSMTGHTSLHLGQLSAWRRADGRPPLF